MQPGQVKRLPMTMSAQDEKLSPKTIARNGILFHPTLSKRQMNVAACLIDHWDSFEDLCFPSTKTIAHEVQMTRANVMKTLDALCEGENRLFDRAPGARGRGRSASYLPRMEVFEYYHLERKRRRRELDSKTKIPAAQYGGDQWKPKTEKGLHGESFSEGNKNVVSWPGKGSPLANKRSHFVTENDSTGSHETLNRNSKGNSDMKHGPAQARGRRIFFKEESGAKAATVAGNGHAYMTAAEADRYAELWDVVWHDLETNDPPLFESYKAMRGTNHQKFTHIQQLSIETEARDPGRGWVEITHWF
jgi:hypothetical protein